MHSTNQYEIWEKMVPKKNEVSTNKYELRPIVADKIARRDDL